MDITLTVRLKAKDFKELLHTVSGNISLGGVFLKTDQPRPAGTVVHLELDLEVERQVLHCDGVVVRCVSPEEARHGRLPAGMAIRFPPFGEHDHRVLAYLLHMHAPPQQPG